MLDPKLIVAAILVATLVLFVWGRWRHDVVAIAALTAAVLTGVVKPAQAFAGFADPAVVTVALVLVLSSAIRQSGLLERALRLAGPTMNSIQLQVVMFTAVVTVLSAFMNNVGALAVIMPLAIASARKAKQSASLLLMPIAFGSLLGGLVTLIGTPPNLLISNVRQSLGGQPFSMFDFAPVGGAVALAGVLYLAFAWRLLPASRRGTPAADEQFEVRNFVTEARVPEAAKAIGLTVAAIEDIAEGDATVIGLISRGRNHTAPPRHWRIEADDVLIIEADAAVLKKVVADAGLELVGDKKLDDEHTKSHDVGTIEVVVTAGSSLVGRSPAAMHLRDFGINLLALSRQDRRRTTRLSQERLREGDVLALQGDRDHLAYMIRDLSLLPLADRGINLGHRASVWLPIGLMVVAVATTTAGLTPISVAFLAAVLVLAVARVMRPAEMYASIDPSIIVLMAALIPVTTAVQETGGTEVVARVIADLVPGRSPLIALTVVMIATLLVTPVLNNAATVLLMGPIAAAFAHSAGFNIDAFLMAVAIGASCDFLTPFGHQSNTLVMGPGGYKFIDYARLGLPLTIIVTLVAVPMIAWVWPLQAG